MVLTGRAALLAAAGVVFVALVMPSWGGVGVVVAVVLVVCLVDVLLAGSPRRLQLSREGDNAVRLGEQAVVQLLVANPGRRVRGYCGMRGRRRPAYWIRRTSWTCLLVSGDGWRRIWCRRGVVTGTLRG